MEHPAGTAGDIPRFDALSSAEFVVGPDHIGPLDEVKVWAHRVNPEGETESMPATATVRAGTRSDTADLSLSRGEMVVPFADTEFDVSVVLRDPARRPT